MNSLEIKDKRAILRKQAEDIINRCKVEVRDLTDDESKEIDDLKEQVKQLDEELKALNERLANLRFDDEDEDAEKSDEEIDKQEIDKEDKKRSTMKKENFSLVRAIRSVVNNKPFDEVDLAVIQKAEEEARNSGIAYQGQIQVPIENRSTITVASEGEDLVATHVMSILEPLRAKNVLINAGARVFSNLRGNVQFPVMSTASCSFESETATASDGSPTFTHVTLSPKRISCVAVLSNMLLKQDEVGVEDAVRQEIINAVNSKIEETFFGTEAGSTTVPEGIFHLIEPTTVSDFEDVVGLEADVDDANVTGECVYVMSNKAKAALRNMARSADSSRLVMEGGEVDGTKAFNTSNVDGSKYVYGDFSNVVIGFFGNMDVIVDNVTLAASACTRVICNLFVDIQVLRKGAFATGDLAGD